MSNNAHELSNRLLNALDSNYNVVDMPTVNEIISILEKFNITKELLETTRLGKHVNELRRKTADPSLARRAKVLVKRWRDLVIPAVASPAHTGSNRSSAERTVRRLGGGTPLTSPALSRHVVSPAVPSPRPLSRPAWGGYESDSQDVILVDDDPPAVAPHKPITPPVKRQPSPDLPHDEKKAKRDKKPKKRRGHSRAGSGTETTGSGAEHSPGTVPHAAVPPVTSPGLAGLAGHAGNAGHVWGTRNGSGPERRRNGWRRDAPDPYAALVNRLPPAGAKKVKTTKELLEQIQSRGSGKAPSRPQSPHSPGSPDVMLIEPDPYPVKVESPLRNGSSELKKVPVGFEPKSEPKPEPEPVPRPKLEDDREWVECTCGEDEDAACPAAARGALRPLHVHALHHALLPGVNGTRAPLEPHRFAVRPAARPERPDLFASVVPLYAYSDYADDHCAKNLARVPLCAHLPWTSFAPPPPDPPPPPPPPDLRPYPSPARPASPAAPPPASPGPAAAPEPAERDLPPVEPAEPGTVGAPGDESSERLKAPLLTAEDEMQFDAEPRPRVDVEKSFAEAPQEHRTVERTKTDVDGRALYEQCSAALDAAPYRYSQAGAAPVLPLPAPAGEAEAPAGEALARALEAAAEDTRRDALGRPERAAHFAEWHECARLGDLIALPYVVID